MVIQVSGIRENLGTRTLLVLLALELCRRQAGGVLLVGATRRLNEYLGITTLRGADTYWLEACYGTEDSRLADHLETVRPGLCYLAAPCSGPGPARAGILSPLRRLRPWVLVEGELPGADRHVLVVPPGLRELRDRRARIGQRGADQLACVGVLPENLGPAHTAPHRSLFGIPMHFFPTDAFLQRAGQDGGLLLWPPARRGETQRALRALTDGLLPARAAEARGLYGILRGKGRDGHG